MKSKTSHQKYIAVKLHVVQENRWDGKKHSMGQVLGGTRHLQNAE